MTSQAAFHKNLATAKKKIGAVNGVQSILNKQTTLEDLYAHLARKAITPDANTGKQRFYAVVTRILEGGAALSDLFLSNRHEIERVNGLSDSEFKSYKIALLHVPDLYTHYSFFDEQQALSTLKPEDSLTSLDLQKIPALTTKDIKIGQIVQIIFENNKDFTGPIILDIDKEKSQTLQGDKKKYESTKEVMKNILACKILSEEKADGYAINSNLSYNLKNPKDYVYAYTTLVEQLRTENLTTQIVLSNTTGQLQSKYDNSGTTTKFFIQKITDEFDFNVKLYASERLKGYIDKNLSVVNSNSYVPKIEINNSIVQDERVLYIDLSGLSKDVNSPIFGDVADFLEAYVEKYLKYSWNLVSQSKKIYALDIFGKSNISKKLQQGTVEDAIKYSDFGLNKSFPSTSSSERTSITPQSVKNNPTQQDAQEQAQPEGAQIKSNLPNCEDQKQVNSLIYTKVEENEKLLQSLKLDNKRLQKITKGNGLKNWLENIESYVMFDFNSSNLTNVDEKIFDYNLDTEIIAVEPENPKKDSQQAAKKQKKKKSPTKIRGTNKEKIEKNGKRLAQFIKELTAFIAQNEGLDQQQVVVFPISVFRKFNQAASKRNSGIDKNSRHFFNRAVDLVVYINNEKKFTNDSTTIPTKGTFEIPNTIVYAYILKLVSATRAKVPFSTCGLGLLEAGSRRKTGYVHYEYMAEVPPNDDNKTNIRPLARRWLSESKDTKTVYGQAFGRSDSIKDGIIKNFIIKQVKSKVGILPTKIENLL